jgi:hypothetical protein
VVWYDWRMEIKLLSGEVLRVEVEEVDLGGFPYRKTEGRLTYWLDDRPISPEEYERLAEQARRGG